MKWIANADVHGVEAQDTDCFSMFPIEADLRVEAARTAALAVAKQLYGGDGEVTFVAPQNDGSYLINVGVYQGGGVTRGRSLTVQIERYEGEQ